MVRRSVTRAKNSKKKRTESGEKKWKKGRKINDTIECEQGIMLLVVNNVGLTFY